jgi:twitching motility protein PilT
MAYDLDRVLRDMVARKASNAHVKVRTPVYFRVLDQLERTEHPVPGIEDLEAIADQLLLPEELERLRSESQADGIFALSGGGVRFRVSFFRQRGTLGLVLRLIPRDVPSFGDLGLPDFASELFNRKRGLILVTGPAASGKTTTVASMLARWSQESRPHMVTLEEPIEYLLEGGRGVVTQRQVGVDTPTFVSGLRHVLRQDPDIVLVGEIRDQETAAAAIAGAETGHLVVSTMQTSTASTTLEQLIGLYPAPVQDQVRTQLSIVLQCVISQALVPSADRSRPIAAFEVMLPTDLLRNVIRQNQIFRLGDLLDTTPGCCSLRKSLTTLVTSGAVTSEDARRAASG